MTRALTATCVTMLLFVLACTPSGPATLPTFLGGNEGLSIQFDKNSPPKEVFDGGDFPFDIVVRLENKGEYFVPKDLVSVSISGVRAQLFNLQDADLRRAADEDLVERKVDSTGQVIEPGLVFAEFKNLNHVSFITGNALTFPFIAEVCYQYGTKAATSLCVRKNLANPEADGLCEIDGTRPVGSSGAPVQVTDVREFQRGKESVGFTFTLKHTGPTTGRVFALSSRCEGGRSSEDRAHVKVTSDVPGLSCQGLSASREGAVEGVVPIYEGERVVTCTQQIGSPADYELPIRIDAQYDYRDSVRTDVVVKHSPDE